MMTFDALEARTPKLPREEFVVDGVLTQPTPCTEHPDRCARLVWQERDAQTWHVVRTVPERPEKATAGTLPN